MYILILYIKYGLYNSYLMWGTFFAGNYSLLILFYFTLA